MLQIKISFLLFSSSGNTLYIIMTQLDILPRETINDVHSINIITKNDKIKCVTRINFANIVSQKRITFKYKL